MNKCNFISSETLAQEDRMESKYRKLYLYASNTQATQKKPNE